MAKKENKNWLTLELDLDGWYSMAGEGEGVWSWVGASSISSEVDISQKYQTLQVVFMITYRKEYSA